MSFSDSFTLHGSETAGENLSAHVSLETGQTWSKISAATSGMTVELANLVLDHDTTGWDLYTYSAAEPSADASAQLTVNLGSCTNSDSFGFGLLHRIDGSGNGYALILVVNSTQVGHIGFLIYKVVAGALGSPITTGIGPLWVQNTTYTIRSRSSGTSLSIDYSLDGGVTWTNGATGTDATTSPAGKSGLIGFAGTTANFFTATNFLLSPATKTIAPDDANVAWATDWKVSHTLSQTTNDGAFVRAAFTGTTSIGIGVDPTPLVTASVPAAKYPKFLARIDGGAWSVYQLPSAVGNVLLASGMNAAVPHTLELRIRGFDPSYDRWTTPANVFQITSFVVDSGAATAPLAGTSLALKPLDAVFYGDSITQGVNVLTSGGGTGDYVNADDATQTYAQLISDSLGVEFINRAYGGQSLTIGTSLGNIPACYSGSSTDSWRNQWSGVSILTSGMLSARTGYVFVNHGVNDLNQSVSAGTMATAVSGFLTALRAATSASCWIIYIVPFGQSEAVGITNGFASYGGAIRQRTTSNGASYTTCTNDPKALLINLNSPGVIASGWGVTGANSYDGVHPTAAGHSALFGLLKTALSTALNPPKKKGGPGRAMLDFPLPKPKG